MFDGPAYASYRQLCRDLHRTIWREGRKVRPRLMPELDLVPGDWRLDDRDDVNLVTEQMRNVHDVVLLPRLDQWLAMLREATGRCDFALVGFNEATGPMMVRWRYRAEYEWWQAGEDRHDEADGDTPEEAAARLWCAVTGRVASG